MITPLNADTGRQSLRDRLLAIAQDARHRYGPLIDDAAIRRMLDDRKIVRYPTGLRYDSGPLEPGEFAYPQALGDHPSAGYCLMIHPVFEPMSGVLPALVAYHLPVINYGADLITAQEAELFGATLLGIEIDGYYHWLCELADQISPMPIADAHRRSGSGESATLSVTPFNARS